MIDLLYSNTMDAFLPTLAEAIAAERQAFGPWRPIRIIVPNQATSLCIEQHLIRTQGISANLDLGFMGRLIQDCLPKDTLLIDRPAIQAVLLRRFRSGEGLEGEAFAQVRSYLQEPQDPKRLAQLSFRLGGLLEEYLYSRPAWALAWETQPLPSDARTMEACQRALWQLVRQDLTASGRTWLTPLEAKDRLVAPEPAGPIHLFGMSHLAYGYHLLLDAIGRLPQTRLTFYALNPCREFWEDHPTGREEALRHCRLGLDAFDLPESAEACPDEDPYGLQDLDQSAPLRHWGRAGREKIRLLNELSDWNFADLFLDPGRTTLLAALKQDILERVTSDFQGQDLDRHDGSIQLHACANPHREAETICDLLWETFRASVEQGDPLDYSDVAILVPPDRLEVYAAHLTAALGERPGIPVSVLSGHATPLLEAVAAFRLLLALPDGTLSRAAILGFLDQPAVRRNLGEAYSDTWRAWCSDTGIIRGRDRADLEPTYFQGDLLNWDQGHRRLALGAFLGADQEPFAQDGETYPARELGSGDWASAGTFIRRTRALLDDLRALPRTPMTLQDWVRRLCALAEAWIGGPKADDRAALDRLQKALSRMAQLEAAPDQPASHAFGCARELAIQELERLEVPRASGGFHGVVLADPASVRGLPFRVVVLAGLAEGGFPAKDGVDDLDLRMRKRLAGDVSASERDRYLFLEALLAARDRFILTYVDRDPIAGDTLEPSPVVTELLDLIDPLVGPAPDLKVGGPRAALSNATLTEGMPSVPHATPGRSPDMASRRTLPRRHPLRRWDRPRFDASCRPWPAQASAYLEARAEARHRGPFPAGGPESDPALGPLPRWPSVPRGGARLRFRPQQLRDFLVSPLQGWGKAILGLTQDREDPDRMEEEAATSEKMDVTVMLREAFWSAQGNATSLAEAYQQSRRRRERTGTVPIGLFSEKETLVHQAMLQAWRESLPQALDIVVPILGAAPSPEAVDPTLGPLSLAVRLGGADPIRVEVAGELCRQGDLGHGAGSIILLAKPVKAGPASARDSLLGWFDHLVLAALAEAPRAHRVYLVGTGPAAAPLQVLEFPAIDPAQARELLTGILERLLGQDHAYLLPITAVLDTQEVPDGAALATWIRHNKESRHSKISCQYGPVPNHGAYPAAGEAELQTWRQLLAPFLTAVGVPS